MRYKQKYYSEMSIIGLLALLSAFPPLSIDLYLPALPHVVEELHASQATVNLSLSLFFIFFALGILLWGPISEKYGRKPILLIGLVLYIVGSASCALSPNVHGLIAARIVQAFGGGAAGAVAAAMVKDIFTGRKRESVLAVIMTMVIIAPVVAPVLGAIILQYMSWTAVFWVLTCVGIVALLLSLRLEETLTDRYTGSLLHSLGRLGVVLKNPGFSILLAVFSLAPLPLMAFIAASSFIYIEGFGMTERMYSYYFAFNALGAIAGPFLYIRLSKRFSPGNIIAICFGLLLVCGILMRSESGNSPTVFALTMAAASTLLSLLRPPTVNLMLSQQQRDTGSVAALISFTGMAMGSLGMVLISLDSQNFIPNLGLMQILVGAICASLWLMIRGRSFICQPA
ncbi:MAG: multidrug effflux MFS transporter [Desulfopila sp.]